MSIEYPFIETMMAEASARYCIDLHRVFIAGHSSRAWSLDAQSRRQPESMCRNSQGDHRGTEGEPMHRH